MSPVSRGRQKKSRPGKRRQHTSPIAVYDDLYRTMVGGFRPLLDERDPFVVEMFTSGLLGTIPDLNGAGHEPDENLLGGLIAYCQRRNAPEAVAALHALRALAASGKIRDAAAAALASLNRPPPPWADSIGAVEVLEAWRMGDVYGDQVNVVTVFGYGERRHALVVLVDFSHLGGWVKDVFPVDDPDGVLAEMQSAADSSDGMMALSPMDPAEARQLMMRGFEATAMTWEPDVGDTFTEYRALALARCRALPDTALEPPAPAEVAEDERDRIVDEFLTSAEAASLEPRESARYCAQLLVDFGCDYDQSRPMRVSPAKLEHFMLGWLPKKVILDDDDKALLPSVVTAWARWTVGRSDLPAAAVEQVVAAAREIGQHFGDAYDDPANASPGRILLSGLGDLNSTDEVQDVLDRRLFTMPYFGTRIGDDDYPQLDPNDPDERRLLIEGEHPEYHAALNDSGIDAEIDGVNPHLHIAMHEIVANQLWADDPPQAWQAAQRLLEQGHDRHDILHALGEVVTTQLHGALTGGQQVDLSAYRDALAALGRSGVAGRGQSTKRSG